MTPLVATFRNIAQELDLNKPLTVMGDLNLDAADTKNADHITMLENIISSSQIVNENTTDQGSILDLAFSNITEIKFTVIENTWSDHKIIHVYHKNEQ